MDLGIIHPYAVAGPGRAVAAGVRAGDPRRVPPAPARPQGPRPRRRPPRPQAGAAGVAAVAAVPARQRAAEARHRRRVRQAQHEAAKTVVGWAVEHRVGMLAVGDPRGVLNLDAGRRHNQRTRDWRDRAPHPRPEATRPRPPGSSSTLVDERGTSSTCPACARRVPKPAGRNFRCPHCGHGGHRDLVAAANIAARTGGGTIPAPRSARGSRTAEPGHTCQVCTRHDVTPGDGPHHGHPPTVPWPAPARPARQPPHGESLATQRGARNTPQYFTGRSTSPVRIRRAPVVLRMAGTRSCRWDGGYPGDLPEGPG